MAIETYAEPMKEATSSMHIRKWTYNKQGAFVEFTIVVQEAATSRNKHPSVHVLSKRFSQFQALHCALLQRGFALPDMPKVDLWTNVLIKLTPKPVLAQRQAQLQRFLDCVSESADVQVTEAYKEFIKSDSSALGYTSLTDVRLRRMSMIRQETSC
ncbi:unnamed protein product [Aphanomyces euteiches]|uniref:PX domain-containing protein n=1 Tax=Aphanomyces euteiches TaxID=100861 RepID=A0A6G0WMI4_9STRA|nr:hypothetical protein Ae201684_013528 [Aphanomyces euteiches]KAH9094360.1 hypothetical protein Ae201684P_016969 [Aphanomyces euteiches]KAH9140954.1 hypothetical protein AeRB84_014847 [Aphanomyces euteiches]